MLKISDFEWDEGNSLHLQFRHGVEPEEVEEVFADKPLFRKTKKRDYAVFGRTLHCDGCGGKFGLRSINILRKMDNMKSRFLVSERKPHSGATKQ